MRSDPNVAEIRRLDGELAAARAELLAANVERDRLRAALRHALAIADYHLAKRGQPIVSDEGHRSVREFDEATLAELWKLVKP